MNDQIIQQQLLQLEVPPPRNLWNEIVVVLDEQKADEPLQQQLLSTEINVPASAWDTIEERLNDQSYTNILKETTVAVPFNVWEQIDAQLDKEADQQIAEKLLAVQETAPAFVWSQIEQQLNEQEPAKIIPISRNYKTIYRLAIAAMITGVMAWGAYRLLSNNTEVSAPLAIERAGLGEQTTSTLLPELTVPETAKETALVPTNSRASVKKRIKEELTLKNTVAYNDLVEHSSQTVVAYDAIHHKTQLPTTQSNTFSESQYFVVLNESGDLVRVSKKLSNLKCANAEGSIPVDAATALQSKDCNEQIKRWQQKMAMAATLSAGSIDLNEIMNTTDQQ